MHPRFGSDSNNLDLLQGLIDTEPKKRSIEAQLLLLEAYQTAFGICDHMHPDIKLRPLASVAMHPKENVVTLGPWFNFIRRYAIYNVQKFAGVSLKEFVEFPRAITTEIFTLCEELSKKDLGALRDLQP